MDATVDLLQRANRGDQLAWEILVERHLHPLTVVARRRLPVHLHPMADPDDVVQEALARSVRHLRHFECRGHGALLAYLRRAVINLVVDTIRQNARQPERLELAADRAETAQSPLDRILEQEGRERYRAGLMRLRVRDRRLIVLRIHHRLSYQEIADRLHMPSPGTTRVASMRAARRLAAAMRKSDGQPRCGMRRPAGHDQRRTAR